MSRGSRARSKEVKYGRQLCLNLPPGTRKYSETRARGGRRLSPAVEKSLGRIAHLLPARSRSFVARVLSESPTEVIPVEARDSKHGDFVPVRGQPFGRITVNTCGNPYQFLLTLLHEVAHARVAARYKRRVAPHGAQWKEEFASLLFRLVAEDILPRDLRKAFWEHALDPMSTADYDTNIQLSLRRYDTLDSRLLVLDLRDGDYFSLDGKVVLQKGSLVRRRIKCTASDGSVYSVLPSARVNEIYPLMRRQKRQTRQQSPRRDR